MEANITMGEINFIAICMLILGYIAFCYMRNICKLDTNIITIKKNKNAKITEQEKHLIIFWLILAISVLIRCIYGGICNYHTDISCFNYWD